MKLFVSLIFAIIALHSAKARDLSSIPRAQNYEDDIYFVMNNVEEKTMESLASAQFIFSERFAPNNSKEVIAQRDEILVKGQTTVSKIEDWITKHNATGALVGDIKDCIAYLLQDATAETYRYINQLEFLCWTKGSFVVQIQQVISKIRELSDEAKDLYFEFLQETVKCTSGANDLQCREDVEKEIRQKAEAILQEREEYLGNAFAVGQSYEESVMVCQKIIYEKIDLIELNVLKGLRDCSGGSV